MPDDIFPKILFWPLQIHSGHSTIFIPEIRNFFCHFDRPFLRVSTKKKTHSDEVADAHRTATTTNTTPNAMQCNATQRNATQRNATQRNATQCNAMQCNATQRKAKQSNATQRNATQRNATQCNATQRKATQCNAMQRNAMQCNATQRQQQRIGCSSNNDPQSLTSRT
jgi:hypothetical protein